MIQGKKARQNELIKTIQEIKKQNENKLKELIAAEEQKEPKTCQRCLQPIPVGYDLEHAVLKSQTNGTLLKIQPLEDSNSKEEKTSIVKKENSGVQIPEGFTLVYMILKSSDGTFSRIQEEPFNE